MADDTDFIQAMKGVRRLNKASAPPSETDRPSNRTLRAQIRQRARHSKIELSDDHFFGAAPELAGQSNEIDDNSLFFLRRGVQKKVLRDLKKASRYPVRTTLDLHGLTQAKAQAEIDQALLEFDIPGQACLLIVHGKGLRSSVGPVLKTFTAAYLKTQPQVRAFCSAGIQDGGTGALYVLLRN